jgi:hypothetical protein
VELILFVWPVLYLARFQILGVFTSINDTLKARRQLQVERWRKRHEAIAASGIELEELAHADDDDHHRLHGEAGRSGSSSISAPQVTGAISVRDKHNMTAITDVLDEVARSAAIDAQAAVRRAKLKP